MVTAREALFAAVKLNNTPQKNFYMALVNGIPEQVRADGFHRSTGRHFETLLVRARNIYEARGKFFDNDGQWVN